MLYSRVCYTGQRISFCGSILQSSGGDALGTPFQPYGKSGTIRFTGCRCRTLRPTFAQSFCFHNAHPFYRLLAFILSPFRVIRCHRFFYRGAGWNRSNFPQGIKSPWNASMGSLLITKDRTRADSRAYIDAKTDAGWEKRIAWMVDRLNRKSFPCAGFASYPFMDLLPENFSESMFHLAS